MYKKGYYRGLGLSGFAGFRVSFTCFFFGLLGSVPSELRVCRFGSQSFRFSTSAFLWVNVGALIIRIGFWGFLNMITL